ncbi:MAG: hypothetical protein V4604_14065 [Bacteroidota bacterium]
MNKLKLSFDKKDYPYNDDSHDPNILWGLITLTVSNETTLLKEVIKWEWNILELLQWLKDNSEHLSVEELPVKLYQESDSIAKRIYNFYNDDNLFDELTADELVEYRERHGLRFGLRGTDIKDVYIGLISNTHTISFYSMEESWNFEIDLVSFLNELRQWG